MKKTLHFFYLLILLGSCGYAQSPIVVENQKLTIPNIGSTSYELKSKGELRVTSSAVAATGTINFTNDSSWLILDNILPSVAIASHLSYILVNGQPAVNNQNVRVTNYLQGCVILPHAPSFEALSLFKEESFGGDEMKCIPLKFYKSADLASFDNTTSSFKLKKGYMATFAQNENGTGYSKVYIAEKEDLEISVLPVGLNNFASFVRVFPWRYTNKKGFGWGDITGSTLLKTGWFYNWGTITPHNVTDIEFVSMRWNSKSLTDNRWKEILNNNYSTHLLGFNEPDADKQANMTLDEMILYWPKMLESGMRLGSPAPAGNTQLLYDFMQKCDELNYRVDFVAIHDYGEGTTQAFYNKCKLVYDKTKRPIWVTEFNWGGTWTPQRPTYAEITPKIKDIIQRYDKEGIIERYSIFNFSDLAQDRSTFLTPASPDWKFTILGEMYRDHVAPMSFNDAEQIEIPLKLVTPYNIKISNVSGITNILKWEDISAGIGTIVIERAFGSSPFSIIAQIGSDETGYVDDVSKLGFGKYNYRLSTKHPGFSNSKGIVVPFELNPNTVFNVALKKPVLASSTLSGYPAENAVDGNIAITSSRWVTERTVIAPTNPVNFDINLEGTFAISQLKIYNGSGGYSSPISSFVLQYNKDGNWIDVVTETSNTSATYSTSFQEVTTDKVRLQLKATADGTGRFYEIEVYGRIATLDTNEFKLNKFNIFPNPVTNVITISSDVPVSKVEIYDINGKLVLTSRQSNSVDVSSLPSGVYFMKFNNGETIKFVKK